MTDDATRPTQPVEPSPPPATAPTAATMPAAAPATATPPAATPPAPARPGSAAAASRTRWIVGLGVAGVAIAVAIGALLLLGSKPVPEALKYVPANSAVVIELRPELPGDQLQKLGNVLSHFPGFLDQATLPEKLDEALSRVLSSTGAGIDYRTDVKPWLNGPTFVAVRAIGGGTEDSRPFGVISATTTGTVTCNEPFAGETPTHEQYRGLDLVIGNDDLACVIDGRQALLGDAQSVRDALDAKATGAGMNTSPRYTAARATVSGDVLATIYLDGTAAKRLMPEPSAIVPPPSAALPIPNLSGLTDLFGRIPEWTMSSVRAEDDAVVIDTATGPLPVASAGPSLLPLPAAHDSVLAPVLPQNTIVFVESQGAGVAVQNLLTQLRSVPELGAPLGILNGLGGGPDGLLGWIEDAGVAVVNGPSTPTFGVVLAAKDDAAAATAADNLRGVLAFAGLGGGVQVTESTVEDVTVTSVFIGDVGALVPPGSIPGDLPVPTNVPVSFSFAAKGRILYVGAGNDVMSALLTTRPGASLADRAFYKEATSRDVDRSRTSVFVDLRTLVELVEASLPQDERGAWESDVRPYVTPFESVSLSTSGDLASGARSRLVINVSTP